MIFRGRESLETHYRAKPPGPFNAYSTTCLPIYYYRRIHNVFIPYRSLSKLQAEEMQVHGGELSKVWKQLEEEQYLRNQLLGSNTILDSKLKAIENVRNYIHK